MSQSTFLVGSIILAFIAWTITRGTFGEYLSALGLGGTMRQGDVDVGPITKGPTPDLGSVTKMFGGLVGTEGSGAGAFGGPF